ncbi:MAG: iron-sulfur cluster assembly accessory protein [Planctomycetota bacterium]
MTLTDKATAKVIELNTEKMPVLRVGVADDVSPGFGYILGFDSGSDAANDHSWQIENPRIAVRKKSTIYTEGTTIDWGAKGGASGFVFDNPNAVSTCE